MAGTAGIVEQRNQEATLYVGNLDDTADDELLWELFTQAGPVVSVFVPRDKVSGRPSGFAFVEFRSETDAEYASKVMNMVKLNGRLIKVNKATADKGKAIDVGANLFVGNLEPTVDEKVLYDTFAAFGNITQHPKIMRDPDTGASKGFGFVNFDSFTASDLAIEAMNGRFLGGRQIVVQYALKAGSKTERHGSAAERALAAASDKSAIKPNMHFASAPGQVTSVMPAAPAPMVGQTSSMPPPMLPPTAILPMNMMPQQAPGMPMMGGSMMGGSMMAGSGGMMPPQLPMMMGGSFVPPPLPTATTTTTASGGLLPPPMPGQAPGGQGMPGQAPVGQGMPSAGAGMLPPGGLLPPPLPMMMPGFNFPGMAPSFPAFPPQRPMM